MAKHVSFHREGILDKFLSYSEADAQENMLDCIVEEGRKDQKSEAEIAVMLVGEWLRRHSFTKEDDEKPGTIHTVSGCEAAGFEQSTVYLNTQAWEEALTQNGYTAAFWDDLFDEDYKYRQENAAMIPDDPIHRMVLHFFRDWRSRFSTYIIDPEVPEQNRLAVLKKQLENFAFFSRKIGHGSLWRMNSVPDELLQQALLGDGEEVDSRDGDGNILKDIVGRPVIVQADREIPPSAGDGPKPDQLDRNIYKYVRRFAEKKLKSKEPVDDRWTMVKGSFSSKGIEVRCYAFSGSSSSKREMPYKWWQEKNGDDAFDERTKVRVAKPNVDQFGNNLVLSLFDALKPSIKVDLAKLTNHVAFEEYASAQALIRKGRNDMKVLDYGEYYDLVVSKLNRSDEITKTTISSILKRENLSQEDVTQLLKCDGKVWPLVTVGSKNRSFTVKEEELEKAFPNEGTRTAINKFARIHLEKLKGDLQKLPEKFLQELEKQLRKSRCGEDNVLSLLLQEVLSMCDVFCSTKVEFVALDQKNLQGKSFCSDCDRKVRFYSVLPLYLRKLGFTGDHFDKLVPLFENLKPQ